LLALSPQVGHGGGAVMPGSQMLQGITTSVSLSEPVKSLGEGLHRKTWSHCAEVRWPSNRSF